MLNSALGDTIRWVLSHFVHLQGLGWVEAHRCLIDTMTATPPREETAISRSTLTKYAIIAASSAAATFLVTLLHGKMSRRRAHRTHVCSDGAAPKTARVKPNPALGGLIVIVGVGGVGSHAAHMLTRAGATNLRLVDFDLITLSSLNRHCSAVHTDVGRQKTAVLAEYIKSYADVSCSIEEIPFTFDKDSANSILRDGEGRNKIAYVLDCIDNTETKAELLQQCLQRGLRVVSSMGAGSRADPTRIHVSNISEVKGDELGRAVRMQLAATSKMDLTQVDIPCVWSSESARKGLVKLSEEQRQKPEDFGNREGFRLGIVPVLGTIPALFGASMASRCISDLCGHPIPFLRLPPMTDHLVTKMTQTLGRTERQITGDKKLTLSVNRHDVEFMISVVWGKADSVTRQAMGQGGSRILIRWDQAQPAARDNLVLVTKVMAAKIMKAFHPEQGQSRPAPGHPELPELTPERVAWIEGRLRLARMWAYQL